MREYTYQIENAAGNAICMMNAPTSQNGAAVTALGFGNVLWMRREKNERLGSRSQL